jgi:hypothetical protein
VPTFLLSVAYVYVEYLVATTLISLAVLAIAAHLTSVTTKYAFYFTFAAVGIGASILTCISLLTLFGLFLFVVATVTELYLGSFLTEWSSWNCRGHCSSELYGSPLAATLQQLMLLLILGIAARTMVCFSTISFNILS